MCELFAISTSKEEKVNLYLEEFMSHGVRHPNGWGMAIFYEDSLNVEKEPMPSYKSVYLKERLKSDIYVQNMIAHIRLATKGKESFQNTHPFVRKDRFGRTWTLAHNGTIFFCPLLDPFVHTQKGESDSERILCYIKEEINKSENAGSEQERFEKIEQIIYELSNRNKLNLLIYDEENLYVHTNYKNSLYMKKTEYGYVFATVPLDFEEWKPVPFCQVLIFKQGKQIYQGNLVTKEYKDNPEDMKYLFLDSSLL